MGVKLSLRCLLRASSLQTLFTREAKRMASLLLPPPRAAAPMEGSAGCSPPSPKLPLMVPVSPSQLCEPSWGIWFVSSWQCHPPKCHGMQKSMKTRDLRHVFLFVCMCQHFQCLKNVCLQKLHVCYSFRIIFSPYNRRLILSF